jgi:phospholipid/cholesterol/gamma-HCH transport system substrate-binding protein
MLFAQRRVLFTDSYTELIRSLATTSADVSNLIREVQSGTGILHALFYSKTGTTTANQMLTTLRDISAASKGFSAIAGTTETQHGVLHDLLYTPVEPGLVARRIEEVLSSLTAVATNLQATSNALAYGSGSLGALIIDPTLYDNLIEVTDGAKRSFLLRQAIRSSLKK